MLHTFTFEAFHGRSHTVCLSDDFVLVERIDDMPFSEGAFKTSLLLFFICLRGHVRFTLDEDERPCELVAGEVFICQPGRPVMSILHSSDCETAVLGYAPRVVDRLMTTKQDTWEMLCHAFANPILHYDMEYVRGHFPFLLELICQRTEKRLYRFAEQQAFHLFASLLFEFINQAILQTDLPMDGQTPKPLSRSDSLFHAFIHMLTADEGCHRTVTYYADRLCISPKHLSNIIRKKTGRRALELINDHAIEQIRLDLKLSDIAINQLASKYKFSNFSFFCQFVKTHLGMTPQEYRAR